MALLSIRHIVALLRVVSLFKGHCPLSLYTTVAYETKFLHFLIFMVSTQYAKKLICKERYNLIRKSARIKT